MLNQIAWYYKRTPVLEIPDHLLAKLNHPLREICKGFTG
jgi:hypothetical protein